MRTFASVGASMAQRGERNAAPDAQPAYGGDQDVYKGAVSSPVGSDDNLAS